MSQPNMSSTVLKFAQTIVKRTVTQTVVNFTPTKTYVDTPFKATITTPQSDDLVQVNITTSLSYKLCHSVEEIKKDDLFVHRNTNYKVIKLYAREDYGYFRCLGEEVQ